VVYHAFYSYQKLQKSTKSYYKADFGSFRYLSSPWVLLLIGKKLGIVNDLWLTGEWRQTNFPTVCQRNLVCIMIRSAKSLLPCLLIDRQERSDDLARVPQNTGDSSEIQESRSRFGISTATTGVWFLGTSHPHCNHIHNQLTLQTDDRRTSCINATCVYYVTERRVRLPSFGLKPVGTQTSEVCDTWPARCQNFPAVTDHHSAVTGTSLYCLVMSSAHVCEQLAKGCYQKLKWSGP